jgi:hydroxymethylbilane synthase
MKIVIGSRGSMLALWQANWVKQRLEAAGHAVETLVIKTMGDRLADVPLAQSGTKGLFIKEIEEALLAAEIDLAVHSLKDLPTEQPAGLRVAAVPEREDPRDVLISRNAVAFNDLARGSRIATSSLRRQAQIQRMRNDVKFVSMRGNIDTRLNKLARGDSDALVLAAAGVRRLGFDSRITAYFSPEEICPAAGQGALAIEVRAAATNIQEAAALLDHPPTHQAVRAERAALQALGGGCQLPIAAYASADGASLSLLAVVSTPDGSQMLRCNSSGPMDRPEVLGEVVARLLIEQGAAEIIATIK